jgi:hypothetical protein
MDKISESPIFPKVKNFNWRATNLRHKDGFS